MNEEQPRKKLSEIIAQPEADFEALWDTTEAASEFAPIPKGEYACRVTSGTRHQSRSGTPSYRLEFTISGGEFAGRKVWLDCWLTAKALATAKRDLLKFGIDSAAKLNRDLPAGYTAMVRVVIREDDNGTQRNEVKGFDVTGFTPPAPDIFAPPGAGL